MRKIQPEKIERVVVRGANWVGDAVMTVPALRELRRVLPRARLTLATRPWAEGIFRGADFIDDIMPVAEGKGVRAFLRQVKDLRARRFDLAILFPNAFAHALVARAARVPLRLGYATDGRGLLLTHPLAVPSWRGERHEVHYYLNIIAELERLLYGSSEIDDAREPDIRLQPSPADTEEARRLLHEHGIRLDQTLVALCPGSTNSRAKRWPVENFAALADMLIERAGAQVVLIGAGEERDISEEVCARMRNAPAVLTGRTTLAQTAAVLSLARLLVTNDTGPAHVAAAVGCHVVVIFGPTNPITTAPFSDKSEVVRRPPECAPCMLRDCPIDHRCMTAITAEEVYERATQIVAPSSRLVEVAR